MKNMTFTSMILGGFLFSTQAMSLTCYLAVAKDSCWLNYDVTVSVVNTSSGASVANVLIPKGTPWVRASFACQAEQTFSLQAQYSPVIWQGTEGQKYNAKNYWQLSNITTSTQAQSLVLCYASDFAEVPIPPNAVGQCSCDVSKIPAVSL